MLLCVCLNPALDVTYRIAGRLGPGESHRVVEVLVRAGGKGVNVARVLGQLASPSTVLGFAGGTDGVTLGEQLREDGVRAVLVPVDGATRRTLTVVDDGQATAFNEPGPRVTPGEWTALRDRFAELLGAAEAVVLSGSLPPGLPPDAYAVLIAAATERGRPVLLDADGAALRHGLAAGPALVTPNLAELRAVLGDDGQDGQDGPDWQDREEWLVESGRRMVAAGARASVVTLGPDGLLATTPDGTWRAHLPEPRPGNPTGAGDALAAVLGQGLAGRRPWPDLLRDAVATSAAALARPVAGEIDPAVRARLAPTVVVEQVAPGLTATQY